MVISCLKRTFLYFPQLLDGTGQKCASARPQQLLDGTGQKCASARPQQLLFIFLRWRVTTTSHVVTSVKTINITAAPSYWKHHVATAVVCTPDCNSSKSRRTSGLWQFRTIQGRGSGAFLERWSKVGLQLIAKQGPMGFAGFTASRDASDSINIILEHWSGQAGRDVCWRRMGFYIYIYEWGCLPGEEWITNG